MLYPIFTWIITMKISGFSLLQKLFVDKRRENWKMWVWTGVNCRLLSYTQLPDKLIVKCQSMTPDKEANIISFVRSNLRNHAPLETAFLCVIVHSAQRHSVTTVAINRYKITNETMQMKFQEKGDKAHMQQCPFDIYEGTSAIW